ncbi:hybrid sensor histidine kinase/response regulator [Geminocystis sp. GBBB08]|uniref:hybrid sensor histidine kinase/response regulator n=1 Tax=Geminocystis sp. GBBB08 TaxID=2604140 RepID=UPI0027E28C65|nr:hybrid sensor histidine kinase/response regulator [Geminocystis sp. GBBB08]MBL1210579.1 hybrid sensor histidine kinase/response regulator [Geminocystis sp. GBBB08]
MDRETQIRFNFLDEAHGYLDQLEHIFLTVFSQEINPESLDVALRCAHSLKGGAGMMGFTLLSNATHRFEDFLKIFRLRFASITASDDLQTLFLEGVDNLRHIVHFYQNRGDLDITVLETKNIVIFEGLRSFLGDLQGKDEKNLFALNQSSGSELELFEEEVDRLLQEFAVQIQNLNTDELREGLMLLGEELMVFSQMADIDAFTLLSQNIQKETMLTTAEDLSSFAEEAVKTWLRSHSLALRGSFDKIPNSIDFIPMGLDFEQDLDIDLTALTEELTALENEKNATPVINSLSVKAVALENEPTTRETVTMIKIPANQLTQFNTLFGKLILERNVINAQLEDLKNFASLMYERMIQLEESQEQLKKWYDRASIEGLINTPTATVNSIGDTAFDILEMDRYSELHLVTQSQIETMVQLKEVGTDIQLGLLDIQNVVRELNQTTTALQKNVSRTQMTPFADVVRQFPRMIRDLGVQFQKKVKLQIEGDSTLIDRAVLEKLNSPLNHLLRNAFDHGIESPNIRIVNGKPPEGKITITAVNRANQTIISIEDDGKGISLDKIRHRLINQGIPPTTVAQMSSSQLLDYIFQPGFSTKEQVTELSGRGVGMDVVRTALKEIRGDIQVKTTEGKGTTFIINIPFSLSVLRVMLLERNGLIFAIPHNSIRELKILSSADIITEVDQELISWHSHRLPLIKTEESLIFQRPYKANPLKGNPLVNTITVLIVGEGNNLSSMYIDKVWGEQEVTVYPIQCPIPLPQGFNSSIILGDGRVIPLVDPVEMLQGCQNNNISSLENINYQEEMQRILIVDDSINVRNYLALTLEKAGYQVEEAKDGREAVDKLFNGLVVKAVISDVEMPRLDGYGLLEEVKGNPELKNLPIIMLTSRSNDKHKKIAFNLGANAYFSKPFNEQELINQLESLIIY